MAPARTYRVVIVGVSTLKGRELKELLEERNFPMASLKLLDDEHSLGQLETVGEEVTFIQSIAPEQFSKADLTFFAGEAATTRKNWKIARDAGSAIIDLSYGLEGEEQIPILSPWIVRERGGAPALDLNLTTLVVAHPAAQVLALLMLRLKKAGEVRVAAASIFEPVSEIGKRGMDELHQQTLNLLALKPLPKEVFGEQVAFNMLSQYGQNSSPSLLSAEERIFSHFQSITGDRVPVPSLTLLQAPIFHGYTFSIHVEMKEQVSFQNLRGALMGEHVRLASASDVKGPPAADDDQSDSDSPSSVNAAGRDEILLSVRNDGHNRGGFWLWAAVDNLRLAAASAVECAASLAAARPVGKLQ